MKTKIIIGVVVFALAFFFLGTKTGQQILGL
jgi:hypothetical protein